MNYQYIFDICHQLLTKNIKYLFTSFLFVYYTVYNDSGTLIQYFN